MTASSLRTTDIASGLHYFLPLLIEQVNPCIQAPARPRKPFPLDEAAWAPSVRFFAFPPSPHTVEAPGRVTTALYFRRQVPRRTIAGKEAKDT